ncbi:MAG: protein phosphatase 2C domain-containing protein [Alphaproteobacteria bacterium]|nr:protein phosphatase 2C domain-containing protein [Alphaproteobacteria bacterium]
MPKTSEHIRVLATSQRGALHKANNMPCQDYCCSKRYKNKLVGIVSDGAGSACYGQIGAKTICRTLCDLLIRSNHKTIRRDIKNAIETARQKLLFHRYNKSKSEADLCHFSATVVGFFYCNGRGIFFHIGDGAGIAFNSGDYDNILISEPENGTFSCETYFYTMPEWKECLRFKPFENINRIMLMSDGVTGFVFSDDFFKIQRKFFIPVVEYLEREKYKTYALRALNNTLNDARAQRLNADDKTILWAEV